MLRENTSSKNSMMIQLALFVAFIAISVLIVMDSCANFVYNPTGNAEQILSYQNSWKTESDTDVSEITRDTAYGSDGVWIHNVLPSNLSGDSALSIQTDSSKVTVLVDGREIYNQEFIMPHNDSGGQYWMFVKLSDNYSGEKIEIHFESKDTLSRINLNQVVSSINIGSPRALQSNIISNNIYIVVLFFICFLLGIIISVFSVLMGAKSKNYNMLGMTSLSTFLIITGIWILFDSVIPQFFISNLVIIRYISYASFMLIIVPFLQYVKTLISVRYLRFDVLSALAIANALISIVLHIANLLPLPTTLIFTHILIITSFFTTCWSFYKEMIRMKNRDILIPLLAVVLLGIGGVAAVIAYYIGSSSVKNVTVIFVVAFTMFIVMLIVNAIWIVSKEFKNSAKSDVYKQLAITDMMTGLYNRSAFDEKISALESGEEAYSKIAFVLFDINNLKKCNDSCGHHIGDRIIRASANCIMNAFQSQTKRYRIGGDEFVVILLDDLADDLNQCLDKFNAEVDHYNSVHTHKLSVAYGTSYDDRAINPDHPITIKTLFQTADKNMYQNKAFKKGLFS